VGSASSNVASPDTASGAADPGASGGATDRPPALRSPTYIGPVGSDLQAIIDAALADAARRTGLAAAALQVVSAQAVTWADGSLGCPQRGMSYTMALVPGHQVRIRAGDQVLDYHAGGRQLILCPPGLAIDPSPVGSG
jgi:hypothetical protein